MINFIRSLTFKKDAAVILFEEDSNFKLPGKTNEKINAKLSPIIKAKLFNGKKNQIYTLLFENKIVVLVGLGKRNEITPTSLRISLQKALLSTHLKSLKDIEIKPNDNNDETIKSIIEAIIIGTYKWQKYISKKEGDEQAVPKKYFIEADKKEIFNQAIRIAEGVNFARDLVNDNADLITSVYIEKTIRSLIKGKRNISIEVLSEKQLKAKGLNLHLAVNKGSTKEPKLIIVKYTGAGKAPYTALIGKGITFDTGGLNLKPSGHMETMKCDMSGTAAVAATLKNAIALNLKKNVLFVCAVAENAIGSRSYKPGDVFKGYAGITVEIGNTDAEGRLVLADAIAYVNKNYKPGTIIDIATLTGACIVALGFDYSGLVSPDDNLANKLLASSKSTDDRIWRLPIYEELKDAITSKIADIKNVSNIKGAGTITAAEFLRRFVGKTKWAHLDIAGPAYLEEGRLYYGYGATGAGVRLLTHYLQNN